MTRLAEITAFVDDLLNVANIPDYAAALNGLQLESRGDIQRIATAVDFSSAVIDGAIRQRAHLILDKGPSHAVERVRLRRM